MNKPIIIIIRVIIIKAVFCIMTIILMCVKTIGLAIALASELHAILQIAQWNKYTSRSQLSNRL